MKRIFGGLVVSIGLFAGVAQANDHEKHDKQDHHCVGADHKEVEAKDEAECKTKAGTWSKKEDKKHDAKKKG